MSAVLSPCATYRYRLERDVHDLPLGGEVIAYFGVNPSTADAEMDDATVRKWRGFSRIYGSSRFLVGNAFAYRATDVGALALAVDPVGPENDQHLAAIAAAADVLVPCWGARGKLPLELHARLATVLAMLLATGKPVLTFGLTKGGDPAHPLMLGYSTPLIPFPIQ